MCIRDRYEAASKEAEQSADSGKQEAEGKKDKKSDEPVEGEVVDEK